MTSLPDCVTVTSKFFDTYGHPMGKTHTAVVENFLSDRPQKVVDTYTRGRNSNQPVMLCGNTKCVNIDHFRWRAKGFYNTEAYTNEQRIFLKLRGHDRDHTKPEDMAEVSGIRTEIGQMTDEELREVIRGQRKLRRAPSKNTSTKKKASPKKPRAKQVQDDLSGLTKEQRLELLQLLGGNPDGE